MPLDCVADDDPILTRPLTNSDLYVASSILSGYTPTGVLKFYVGDDEGVGMPGPDLTGTPEHRQLRAAGWVYDSEDKVWFHAGSITGIGAFEPFDESESLQVHAPKPEHDPSKPSPVHLLRSKHVLSVKEPSLVSGD